MRAIAAKQGGFADGGARGVTSGRGSEALEGRAHLLEAGAVEAVWVPSAEGAGG